MTRVSKSDTDVLGRANIVTSRAAGSAQVRAHRLEHSIWLHSGGRQLIWEGRRFPTDPWTTHALAPCTLHIRHTGHSILILFASTVWDCQ